MMAVKCLLNPMILELVLILEFVDVQSEFMIAMKTPEVFFKKSINLKLKLKFAQRINLLNL
jgi:hypothetical protein